MYISHREDVLMIGAMKGKYILNTESAAAIETRMVDAMKNKKTFPEQEEDHNQALEIMKSLVILQQKIAAGKLAFCL
jgi:hypothetical protein